MIKIMSHPAAIENASIGALNDIGVGISMNLKRV